MTNTSSLQSMGLKTLKVIGVIYGIILLNFSVIALIDSAFPNNGPYKHLSYLLYDITGALWSYPMMAVVMVMFAFTFIFPIIIHEGRTINRKEKFWTVPNGVSWFMIGLFGIVPGGMWFGLINENFLHIARGPWNIFPCIIFGLIHSRLAYLFVKKIVPKLLEKITRKMFF